MEAGSEVVFEEVDTPEQRYILRQHMWKREEAASPSMRAVDTERGNLETKVKEMSEIISKLKKVLREIIVNGEEAKDPVETLRKQGLLGETWLQWVDGGKSYSYSGEDFDGKPWGEGTEICQGGQTYRGGFREGKYWGKGRIDYSSASDEYKTMTKDLKGNRGDHDLYFEGNWLKGVRHGKGKFVLDGQTIQEGNWVNGTLQQNPEEQHNINNTYQATSHQQEQPRYGQQFQHYNDERTSPSGHTYSPYEHKANQRTSPQPERERPYYNRPKSPLNTQPEPTYVPKDYSIPYSAQGSRMSADAQPTYPPYRGHETKTEQREPLDEWFKRRNNTGGFTASGGARGLNTGGGINTDGLSSNQQQYQNQHDPYARFAGLGGTATGNRYGGGTSSYGLGSGGNGRPNTQSGYRY